MKNVQSLFSHFSSSVTRVINQGQSWDQAPYNAGITVSVTTTTNWGYSGQSTTVNPAYATGGGGNNSLPKEFTWATPENVSSEADWSLTASTNPDLLEDEWVERATYWTLASSNSQTYMGSYAVGEAAGFTHISWTIDTSINFSNNRNYQKDSSVLHVHISAPMVWTEGKTMMLRDYEKYSTTTHMTLTNILTGETQHKTLDDYNREWVPNDGIRPLNYQGEVQFNIDQHGGQYELVTITTINLNLGWSGNWTPVPFGKSNRIRFQIYE